MTAHSKLNPGFADRLITMLTQADIRPNDLAARIDVPLEVIEACLKGKVPEAEVLYRIAKVPEAEVLYRIAKVPEAEVLYRIAKGLDTTMEWLLTGEEVRIPKESLH
jgi:transcriptional regulator with XRE-family HTH domain